MKGEYYWSSLAKDLEACPKEASGNQWLTVVVLFVASVVAVALYAHQDTIHNSLGQNLGKFYKTPANTVRFATANGRSKVLWTNIQILVSISWTMNIGESVREHALVVHAYAPPYDGTAAAATPTNRLILFFKYKIVFHL